MISPRHQSSERGAVALITAVIISILLTIIVTGLITLMASELRQSSDAEQSTRAYYAAQSGIENGVQKVIGALPGHYISPVCPRTGSSKTSIIQGIPVGWTCQSISYSGNPEGTLNLPDQTTQIDLTGAPNFDKVTLQWDNTSGPFNMPAPLPTSSVWSGAAAVEMTFVDYSKKPYSSAQVAQGDIKTQNVLAIPSHIADTEETVGTGLTSPDKGSCSSNYATYHCIITLKVPNSAKRNYIIRLRSRYQGTPYKLSFTLRGEAVNVPDGTATIDVTAKAGDVFRRVIYKVPITNSAASGLDYVLFSDNNICKNYTISAGVPHGYPCTQD